MNEYIHPMTDFLNTDPFLVFFGCFFVVIGLSAFMAEKSWNDFIDLFVENDALSLVMGIVILPISLFLIFFYNNWETLGSTVLTVTGYLMFIKALVLLLRPAIIQRALKMEFVRKWLWLDGISGVALGVAMLVL